MLSTTFVFFVERNFNHRYKDYQILHDPMYESHRQMVENRYADPGIVGIITDIEILRNCNFFVGTFSSNVSFVWHLLIGLILKCKN